MNQTATAQSIELAIKKFIEAYMHDKLQQLLDDYDRKNVGPDRTMDIKEASEYLGVSDKMLYKMCDRKQIPHWRMGKRKLFSLRSLIQWCKDQEQANYLPSKPISS